MVDPLQDRSSCGVVIEDPDTRNFLALRIEKGNPVAGADVVEDDPRKKNAITLAVAKLEAEALCQAVRDVCERIEIAGSIRRKKPFVHDIDIVAIPRFELSNSNTLFADPERINLLDQKLAELTSLGRFSTIAGGKKIYRLKSTAAAIPVDLYVAEPKTWATLLLIRTGSREHNIYLCSLARRLGMQLKADGSGLYREGKIIASNSEEEIFRALGLDSIPPENRERASTHRSRQDRPG